MNILTLHYICCVILALYKLYSDPEPSYMYFVKKSYITAMDTEVDNPLYSRCVQSTFENYFIIRDEFTF